MGRIKGTIAGAMTTLAMMLAGASVAATAPQGPVTSPRTVDVTMYNLIARPERYDGKVVRVIGVGHFETSFGSENTRALFATRDDQNHSTCARVDVDDVAPSLKLDESKLAALTERYVIAEGIFSAAPPLPLDVEVIAACPGAGTLRAVTRLQEWEFGD